VPRSPKCRGEGGKRRSNGKQRAGHWTMKWAGDTGALFVVPQKNGQTLVGGWGRLCVAYGGVSPRFSSLRLIPMDVAEGKRSVMPCQS